MKIVTTKQQREISDSFLRIIEFCKLLARTNPTEFETINEINLKIGNLVIDIISIVGGQKEIDYIADTLMEALNSKIKKTADEINRINDKIQTITQGSED